MAFWKENQNTFIAIDTLTDNMPVDYSLSEHGKISFSEDGTSVYLGLAPKPLPTVKDSLIDDEKSKC